MTGFGSFCQPATVLRGKIVFSVLSPSSPRDKRLLCSTQTMGRPLAAEPAAAAV